MIQWQKGGRQGIWNDPVRGYRQPVEEQPGRVAEEVGQEALNRLEEDDQDRELEEVSQEALNVPEEDDQDRVMEKVRPQVRRNLPPKVVP